MFLTKLFILLLILFIVFHLIEKALRKFFGIGKRNGILYKYVNKFHKIGERSIMLVFFISFTFVSFALPTLHSIQPTNIMVIYFGTLFSFRTFIEWKYARKSKEYIISGAATVMYIVSILIFNKFNIPIVNFLRS
ncbi:DUF4181 domain-containing protein [Clostridium formicaceticum]